MSRLGLESRLALKERLGIGTDLWSAGASSFANHPAPAGYHWAFVTDQSVRVTDQGVPVVDLVAN